ncbi:hypothetical protein KEM55_007466 [Ascosphaera atra]|nr:hypothetical protein KEM55_007466 [Ascosphaera atra]
MNATRAYCPQYAWIQNATVRDNIIFGKAYDEEWYNEVIDACALRADLESFMAGDQTEIGERGITVSGGQKQRLNIARAIYFDTELVLLDDPLSAVDAHVGRHIMDNAICGLLKDKCRILATHQLHVLSRCDRIIVMDQGKIESIGTYDQLMEESEGFKRLLSTTAQEGSSKPEEQESSKDEEITEAENADKSAMDKSTPAAPSGPLMQAEERATSSVGWDVWKAYISSFGTYGFLVNLPLILVSLIASNGGNVVTSLWLSWWTSENFDLPAGVYMGMYAGLGGIQVLLMFTFSTAMSLSTTNASRTMFLRAMTRVLRAPMSFFDTTPLGRITNRFSKDIHTMDNELTDAMRIFYLTVSLIISVLILVIVFFHWVGVSLGP